MGPEIIRTKPFTAQTAGEQGEQDMLKELCRDLVQQSDDDVFDEGYFYENHPEDASLGKPEETDQ